MITDRNEIDEIIRGSEVCRIAMSKDDSPYLVPMSFGYDGDAVYIHTKRTGKKIEYIQANNRVCFEFERNVKMSLDAANPCESTFSYQTVIGFGTINELVEPERKKHALQQIVSHYGGGQSDFSDAMLAAVRVWAISIDSMTAKKSPKE